MIDLEKLRNHDLTGSKAADEIERLRSGIQTYLSGDYSSMRKNDKCKHGHYGFETCEACIDEYFEKLLAGT